MVTAPDAAAEDRAAERDQREPAPPRPMALALLTLGIVFGDIGTSPLYALRECFLGRGAPLPGRVNVLGVLSLIFWSLIIVISIKYLLLRDARRQPGRRRHPCADRAAGRARLRRAARAAC